MKIYYYLITLLIIFNTGCKKYLEEEVYSQLSGDNYLTTEDGLLSVLEAGYYQAYQIGYSHHCIRNYEEWCTDIEWETAGGENAYASLLINFNWDASLPWLYGNFWEKPYEGVRDANLILENLDNAELNEDTYALYQAEARYIRALSYYQMYMWFGPVPLRTSSDEDLYQSRATDDEMQDFLETELLAAISDLPDPGNEEAYGRATSGAARALLCKFYLNTKQWQNAADMAQDIIDMGSYSLYEVFGDMFKVENEENSEYILVFPMNVSTYGIQVMPGFLPSAFSYSPELDLTYDDSWSNWAAQYRLYDDFYNSFETGDSRKNPIISYYINTSGDTISLEGEDNTRSFKYYPDPNGTGDKNGNDIPYIRYADILLARAEALNELNGPNQESIDLINQIRNRAELADISLDDYSSTDDLRSHILDERGWEFYNEAKRREDMIRIGTFISSAQERGISGAVDYRTVFPIPQDAMDENPNLIQNEGY